MIYFDTSALVKRYDPREAGAGRVIAFFATQPRILTSAFTINEVISAFRIKERGGQFTAADVSALTTTLDFHTNTDYDLVLPQADTLLMVRRLLLTHKIRHYDAMHIATALTIARATSTHPAQIEFWTSDHDQTAAARAEGFTVIAV